MGENLGRYELVEKLATGGMADVWLARQWGSGEFRRDVVVKRLHPHLAEQPGPRADFENEATLLAILARPGIPHVYEFSEGPDGRPYVVMERVQGPTLAAALEAERPAPIELVLAAGAGIAELLAHVHRLMDSATGQCLHIVHGDVTPDNVLLGPEGRVSLLDFGIAGSAAYRETRQPTVEGLRGTLGYIAPEGVRSARELVDHRADLFSLGVVLFELLTGERPFPEGGVAFVNAVVEQDPPRPRERRAEISEALDDLVMELLAKHPAQRPESAAEVRARLRSLPEAPAQPEEAVARFVDAHFPARPTLTEAEAEAEAYASEPPAPKPEVFFSSFPPAPETTDARMATLEPPMPPQGAEEESLTLAEELPLEPTPAPTPKPPPRSGTTLPPPPPLAALRSRRAPRPPSDAAIALDLSAAALVLPAEDEEETTTRISRDEVDAMLHDLDALASDDLRPPDG